MSSLPALQLLSKAAHIAQRERETFSKPEIVKKINEIKYLSTQKKVPKLTLRKELIHLESQLKGVMELERKMLREKNKESTKVTALRKQIEMLKNKLATVEGEELDKKVERLSFLLGEHLAKKDVSKEIAMTQKWGMPAAPPEEEPDVAQKVMMLQRHIDLLKNELALHQELETKHPEELRVMEDKIAMIEEKLQKYKSLLPAEKPMEIKHRLLFEQPPSSKEVEVEEELPLPPPPRMEGKD